MGEGEGRELLAKRIDEAKNRAAVNLLIKEAISYFKMDYNSIIEAIINKEKNLFLYLRILFNNKELDFNTKKYKVDITKGIEKFRDNFNNFKKILEKKITLTETRIESHFYVTERYSSEFISNSIKNMIKEFIKTFEPKIKQLEEYFNEILSEDNIEEEKLRKAFRMYKKEAQRAKEDIRKLIESMKLK